MSTAARPTESLARDGRDGTASRDRLLGRIAIVLTTAVALWSVLELVNLAGRHTTGAELYGVLTAAVAAIAGIASLILLRTDRARALVVIVVLVVWAVVALAGIAGVAAHIVGPVPGHDPVDVRPRPILAPLVFTALGVVGGISLFVGTRARQRATRPSS